MNVKVNGKALIIFRGATVRDAVLRHFAKCDIDKELIGQAVVCDKWGHVIGKDATLSEGQEISYKIE